MTRRENEMFNLIVGVDWQMVYIEASFRVSTREQPEVRRDEILSVVSNPTHEQGTELSVTPTVTVSPITIKLAG